MRTVYVVHNGGMHAVNVVSETADAVLVERGPATPSKTPHVRFKPDDFHARFASSPVGAVLKAIEKRRAQIRWHDEQTAKLRAEIVALNAFETKL